MDIFWIIVLAAIVIFAIFDKMCLRLQKERYNLILIGTITTQTKHVTIICQSSMNNASITTRPIMNPLLSLQSNENIFQIIVCIISDQNNDNICNKVRYTCIMWIIVNVINIIWDYKWNTNINSGNILNENRIIGYTLKVVTTLMQM